MKKVLLLLLLCNFSLVYSQVQMYRSEPKDLQAFKNSTTIFILSDVYDTPVYEKILKDVWTVTPYKIVKRSDFNFRDYLDDKHSFAFLESYTTETKSNLSSGSGIQHFHTNITFCIYNVHDKLKEIEKYEQKSEKKKAKYNIFREDRTIIANISLMPNGEMAIAMMGNNKGEVGDKLWKEDLFVDYKPGILKNYFQKINKFIDTNTTGGVYNGNCTDEVKNLKKITLYIPSLVGLQTEITKSSTPSVIKEKIAELLTDYNYKYEIIDDVALNDKIISGEEFYYLWLTRTNSERFVQIVNSKTGESVYNNYHPLGYFFKPKHIEELKKAINTGKVE